MRTTSDHDTNRWQSDRAAETKPKKKETES